MLLRSHIIRLVAVLAVLLQVALPAAQAQAAANGEPLSSLICNPSGQPLNAQAEAAMTDLLAALGDTDAPEPMPDCERCVVPGVAVLDLSINDQDDQRFPRIAHRHPLSEHVALPPVRGPPCGTRAPPTFV